MLTHGLLDLTGITAYRFRYLVGNRICRLCAAYMCAVWRSWPGADQPIPGD
jgi:hypothetical protein